MFRGVLQTGLVEIAGKWPGLIAASIAFGLAHPISKPYVITATLVGIFLGGLFLMTGNLLAPVVAHATYDFCALAWLVRRTPPAPSTELEVLE